MGEGEASKRLKYGIVESCRVVILFVTAGYLFYLSLSKTLWPLLGYGTAPNMSGIESALCFVAGATVVSVAIELLFNTFPETFATGSRNWTTVRVLMIAVALVVSAPLVVMAVVTILRVLIPK